MHHIEAHARRRGRVVQDVDSKRRCVYIGGVETERCRQDVERARDSRGVDEDNRSAVRRYVVKRRDAGCPIEAFCTDADCTLVAAEVDVLAGERRL
jgi:hypothetical protein